MKQAIFGAMILILTACGDGYIGSGGPEDWADSEAYADEWVDDGTPAAYDDVGEVVGDEDPTPGYDACLDDDICPDDAAPAGDDLENDGTTAAYVVEPAGGYQPGDLLLVLKYAPLRKEPSGSAGVKPVHTNGGVHDGHPAGSIPPGQVVTMLDEPRTNRFYKVSYKGYQGWVHKNKLALVDESMHPVKFARQAAVRNAFFMHQIRRAKWNKDGPYGSANCAPTSLAMAAKIFDLAAPGRTIERGIHEARDSYGASADESVGTTRAQIREGAKALGFTVHELGTNLATANDEMDRLDKQLGWNRVVALEGQAKGSDGAAYRNRMTEAYHAQGVTGAYYYYEGRHSILVVALLPSGKYLVADPLSEVGMVTMSRFQLKSFIKYWGGTGNSLHL